MAHLVAIHVIEYTTEVGVDTRALPGSIFWLHKGRERLIELGAARDATEAELTAAGLLPVEVEEPVEPVEPVAESAAAPKRGRMAKAEPAATADDLL